MSIRPVRFPFWLPVILLDLLLGLSGASVNAAEAPDVEQVQTKVEPSVVEIKTNTGLGSGYVVAVANDYALVMTNYHVIEGAKQAALTFPADKDKKFYTIEGFLAVLPSRDMALLAIKRGDKKIVPLRLAEKVPARGEWVATFGSPLGLPLTAAEGKISAVRSGTELVDETKRGPTSIYTILGYELSLTWLQHTAPMSHGNSGGPLLNARAEVIGMNTWTLPEGQNLNFAISATHIKEFIAAAGRIVHPLASLPAPSAKHAEGPDMADLTVTLAIWKQFNRAKNALDAQVGEAEKRLEAIPALDPRNPRSVQNTRNKKVAKQFKDIAKSYTEYSKRLSSLKNEKADAKLIQAILRESNASQKVGAAYQELAGVVLVQGGSREPELATSELKQHLADLRTDYDLLRVNLSRKYEKTFPTLEDTANEGESAGNDDAKKDDTAADGGGHKGGSSTDPGKRSLMRTWTDASGAHHTEAKFLGMEDGKAKLEKADGTILRIAPASLSDADRRFIGEE
jgi:S1-C subfamily serine protease